MSKTGVYTEDYSNPIDMIIGTFAGRMFSIVAFFAIFQTHLFINAGIIDLPLSQLSFMEIALSLLFYLASGFAILPALIGKHSNNRFFDIFPTLLALVVVFFVAPRLM